MKVRAILEINKETNDLSVVLDKDGNVGCLVGFYPIEEYDVLKKFVEDLNSGFGKLWH